MTTFSVPFQVGQRIKVLDTEKGYELTVLTNGEAGATVVTVGPDYLELEDASADIKVRIPFFLIRSVTAAPEAQPQQAA